MATEARDTAAHALPNATPPRENLIRAAWPGVELRAAGEDEASPVMVGHFAVFNQWTEINSMFEGNFMERFAPGAFKKTMTENRDGIRALFQHGRDTMVGDKPLGAIRELKEDSKGGYYEVPLLDAPYVRETVLPGLEAGLYGASFRFRVIQESINEDPGRSATNPNGLPERTVTEARLMEFGPVTFPAYAGATAGVRSLTDEFLVDALSQDPERFKQLIDSVRSGEEPETPAAEEAPEVPDPTETDDEPAAETEEVEVEESPALSTPGAEVEPHSNDGSRAANEPLYGTRREPTKKDWRL